MDVICEVALSDAEDRFIAALARGEKPTKAAIAAGVSAPCGTSWLKKPHIQAAVKHILANLLYVANRIQAGA